METLHAQAPHHAPLRRILMCANLQVPPPQPERTCHVALSCDAAAAAAPSAAGAPASGCSGAAIGECWGAAASGAHAAQWRPGLPRPRPRCGVSRPAYLRKLLRVPQHRLHESLPMKVVEASIASRPCGAVRRLSRQLEQALRCHEEAGTAAIVQHAVTARFCHPPELISMAVARVTLAAPCGGSATPRRRSCRMAWRW
jgi:hypothetical protein